MKRLFAVLALVGATTVAIACIASNIEYIARSLENYKKIYGSDEHMYYWEKADGVHPSAFKKYINLNRKNWIFFTLLGKNI